ncbi:dehydrin COR47, partial [Camellia sinensis]|uniref:dehydrin COR47 n=1 Tax=Camellia sinensis TaxID=4442 RepID=UPI001035AF2C
MGCGKSKHDVAAGNTISKSKSNKNTNVETIPENVTNDTNTTVQQQKEESEDAKENNVSPVKQEERGEGEKGESKNGDSKKDVATVVDLKEGDNDKKDSKEKIEERGVEEVKQDSKTVDTVEAIVSNKVDVSEESEKSKNVVEEKGSVEEVKTVTENGIIEPVKVNEEKAKDVAPATIEPEAT